MKVNPYHSVNEDAKPETKRVYHTHNDCRSGREIPDNERRKGAGDTASANIVLLWIRQCNGVRDGNSTPSGIQRVVTLLSPLLQCPVHSGSYCFADCPPFTHNIRLRPDQHVERWPKRDHVFIYSITHIGTGVRYVGYTEMRLSERWAIHRSARKSEKRKNDPLYRAMNEDGLHMFVMEELEQCGKPIKRKRELDYMRKLESWNPKHGYNSPGSEAIYARDLYFLLNPDQELRYEALRQNLKSLDDGWREPLPHDQKLREELQEVTDAFLQEGRRLMKGISSLASPVVSDGWPISG